MDFFNVGPPLAAFALNFLALGALYLPAFILNLFAFALDAERTGLAALYFLLVLGLDLP